MEALNQFTIPIEGLASGMHQFDFQIDKLFFDHFKKSPIKNGNFDLKLHLDKRPDMLVLTFEFSGSFMTECDRCLEIMNLPITDSQQLMVKYSDQPSEEAEIVYITRDTKMLNVATYAYECICLAIPFSKVCEMGDNPPCNEKMLDYLDGTDEDKEANPIWEALKKLKKDN